MGSGRGALSPWSRDGERCGRTKTLYSVDTVRGRRNGSGGRTQSASEYTQGRGPAKTAHKTWLGERKEEGRKEGGGQSSRRDSRVIRCG